MSGGMNQRKII